MKWIYAWEAFPSHRDRRESSKGVVRCCRVHSKFPSHASGSLSKLQRLAFPEERHQSLALQLHSPYNQALSLTLSCYYWALNTHSE